MSDEKPMEVYSLPRINGGVVTRMSVLPSNGTICYLDIETSKSFISFPEPLKFILDAPISASIVSEHRTTFSGCKNMRFKWSKIIKN